MAKRAERGRRARGAGKRPRARRSPAGQASGPRKPRSTRSRPSPAPAKAAPEPARAAPPSNAEIARTLERVASLIALDEGNPFRIRAYRNAARTIGNLSRSVAEMLAAGEDLRELPGIGEDLADHIEELVRTGRLRRLEEFEKRVPSSLSELLTLEEVGPKRARRLYDELGVTSIAELEEAIEAGRVERMRGFGKKSAERLRQAIRDARARAKRYTLAEADELVEPLLEYLRAGPGVERVEVVGSYRRRRETVGDLDVLAICERSGPAMEYFAAFPGVARVESSGPTMSTVVLASGLRVDLRILPKRSFGAAMHHFTGSGAHNIAIRTLGIERGIRINEYGVFRLAPAARGASARSRTGAVKAAARGKAKRIGGEREQDVFDALDLPWIPPELRENRGEIEAARKGRLPKLIELDDIRGDLQMHSTWSDGQDTIEAMARACKERGYRYMAITDHSRSARIAHGMTVARMEEQWKEIDAVREKVEGIEILRGMEVDILRDGRLDLADEYLEQLDVVVVGVHSSMGMDRKSMTDRIIRGISHPAVHILAHPTGRLLGRREPYDVDIEAVLRAAAELGVAVELNAQPDRLDLSDVYARRAKELGVMVVIDTDAHATSSLDFMRYGVDQARRGWLEKKDVLNTRPLGELRKWLARKRRRRL